MAVNNIPIELGSSCRFVFQIADYIARGAFGTVYKGTITDPGDFTGDKVVAIKVVYVDKTSKISICQESWTEWRKRIKLLLQLKHDNLVSYHKVEVLKGQGGPYFQIMMDYLDGDLASLFHKLRMDEGLLAAATVKRHMLEMARGLNFLHSLNIIHGDLKPANVLIKQVKSGLTSFLIGDLDDVVRMQREETCSGDITHIRGTTRYMSPEMLGKFVQLRAESPGRKTDSWSLGCIMLELANFISGEHQKWLSKDSERPIAAENANENQYAAFVMQGYAPFVTDSVPGHLAMCIRQCLKVMSQYRMPADELVSQLENFRPQTSASVPSKSSATDNDECQQTPFFEYLQSIRHVIAAVINSGLESATCYGGIFPENIFCGDSQAVTLGGVQNLLRLWMMWIDVSSRNVIYIPPEGIAALPDSTGDTSKSDSWALGCLTISLINNKVPPKLVRCGRIGSTVKVFKMQQPLLPNMQAFYSGAKLQTGFVIGPKIDLVRPIPGACEDFLGHCLELDPAKRWSLQQLQSHPFVDLSKTVKDLCALDTMFFEEWPSFKEKFELTKVRTHPYLRSDDVMLPHQLGELVYKRSRDLEPRVVDIWRFALHGKGAHELQKLSSLWMKAFGRLVCALTIDYSAEELTSASRIRALQDGSRNVLQHFGCRFVEPSHSAFPLELQIFTEHCTGRSFKDVANYKLSIEIIVKWTREVLRGLKYLNGHSIAHRSVNSNVILFSEAYFMGTIKIGGFQYMRQLETDRTERHGVSARQGQDGRFAAPEMVNSFWEDVDVGRKCDIWSLGCVVLHLVTGNPPLYIGAKNQPMSLEMAVLYHLNSADKKLPCVYEWIPTNIQDLIKTCLKFDPLERPDAAELLQSLEIGYLGITGQDTAEYLANRKALWRYDLVSQVGFYWDACGTGNVFVKWPMCTNSH
ncbi:uncharacterized protein LOC129600019 isoform X2 [Paramacrobiotus metropolitanus]|uniref:uncharacterized protein LOC129600019 isoform X2 n=1 Tax=Paramacrobiotus metropolitanus TaxID=2943436 RepID=UPI002445CA87|nr:uncharacterized protein LOC129600019 isoform X2 [Paramacrobiotus metropolitanus]